LASELQLGIVGGVGANGAARRSRTAVERTHEREESLTLQRENEMCERCPLQARGEEWPLGV
jgi:hypothetical protein